MTAATIHKLYREMVKEQRPNLLGEFHAFVDACPRSFTPKSWKETKALQQLGIRLEKATNGLDPAYGEAFPDRIVLKDDVPNRLQVLIHELAHILLGHTDRTEEGTTASCGLPSEVREVHAELTCHIVMRRLGFPQEFLVVSSYYVNLWAYRATTFFFPIEVNHSVELTDNDAVQILSVSNTLLVAGQV